MKITTTRQTLLKPLPIQSADIKQRNLIVELPADAEIEITGFWPVDSQHTYVLFKNDERGFLYNTHFEKEEPVAAAAANATIKLPSWDLDDSFVSRIVRYMIAQEWPIYDGYRERNIVYFEGAETDGTPNADRLNEWNDFCSIISFDKNKPYFVMAPVAATTEPGRHYTMNPMNTKGAARVGIGYHKAAWCYGRHGYDQQEALVQSGPLTVYRDKNKDGLRTGDLPDTGDNFGINQHGPYSGRFVDRSSAGCLVRRNMADHLRFMALLKDDPRFKANRWHRWGSTVIDATDFKRFVK